MSENTKFPKLASPAQRALQNAGIFVLPQLQDFSEKELLSLHGMGPNAVNTLRNALHELGLSLKEE
jgi:hypothetical protein